MHFFMEMKLSEPFLRGFPRTSFKKLLFSVGTLPPKPLFMETKFSKPFLWGVAPKPLFMETKFSKAFFVGALPP